MDPVTISSLLAAAAGALGSEAVKDLYQATKQAIKDLFAKDENLLEALDDVEDKPQSKNRRKMLEEQLGKVEITQHQDILDGLVKLESFMVENKLYSPKTYIGRQSGSGSLVQGKKNIGVGKGGVAAKKIKKFANGK